MLYGHGAEIPIYFYLKCRYNACGFMLNKIFWIDAFCVFIQSTDYNKISNPIGDFTTCSILNSILSVIAIICVHVRHICRHILKTLQVLLPRLYIFK